MHMKSRGVMMKAVTGVFGVCRLDFLILNAHNTQLLKTFSIHLDSRRILA